MVCRCGIPRQVSSSESVSCASTRARAHVSLLYEIDSIESHRFGHLNQFNLVHWHKRRKHSRSHLRSHSPVPLCALPPRTVMHDFHSDGAAHFWLGRVCVACDRRASANANQTVSNCESPIYLSGRLSFTTCLPRIVANGFDDCRLATKAINTHGERPDCVAT